MNLGYSWKNIPIPSAKAYRKRLIEMAESVIKRMRWKAFFFLRGDRSDAQDENGKYGLKRQKCPPQIEALKPFEADMLKLIDEVEFTTVNDDFQKRLRADIESIRNSDAVFVPADKTRNLYKMGREQYDKLLRENITKHYKLAPADAYSSITVEAQGIARKLNVDDRMDITARKEAFITLKDHKQNFPNSLPCRLINPAKSEVGLISKRILNRINANLGASSDVQLWRNSADVVNWFQSLEDKGRCVFSCFDIVEFYPSISENLLNRALDFASLSTNVTDEERMIILHARKSLLFDKDRDWVKNGKGLFDVTMGSYDGAEICELVGTFALTQLPRNCKKTDIGLYRDDGLAVHRVTSGREAERTKKDLVKRFNDLGLKILIETNLKVTNFLDLTLNLKTGRYHPYRKPNDSPSYINRLSNHPPPILKNIPAAVSRRITDNSSDPNIFNEAAPLYDNALKASGYSERIEFLADRKASKTRPQRKRSRNII